jgi:hypothetical protein
MNEMEKGLPSVFTRSRTSIHVDHVVNRLRDKGVSHFVQCSEMVDKFKQGDCLLRIQSAVIDERERRL